MADFLLCEKSELRDIDLDKLDGFKSFFCVINTDKWSGQGLHWCALFALLNKEKKTCCIEYFNSSSNGIDKYTYTVKGEKRSAISDWLEHLRKNTGWTVKIKEVVKSILQHSETECGVYCLKYIQYRLEGRDSQFFQRCGITDEDMIKYGRPSLFS